MRTKFFLFLLYIASFTISAQDKIRIRLTDSDTKESILSAIIKENSKAIGITDTAGIVSLQLSPGTHTLSFSSIGYDEKSVPVSVPYTKIYEFQLSSSSNSLEEVSVVASTRNNQKIENSPLKVEILGKEEMEEENTIKPANIASILGDISGIQIQQSSAVSGNANVRIQGLEGRYTQILRDGMPLYDGFSGGFGILSIPPLDLRQLELIKGSASTLYGGGAIGGLVNIISKTPTEKQQGVITLNQSTAKETNLNIFVSKKQKHFGYTFFGGATRQLASDVNEDAFSDIADLSTLVVHPRLFWYLDDKTTLTTGYTGTFENRNGGDMLAIANKPDSVHQFFENNNTVRHSGELLFERKLGNDIKLEFKNSISSFNRKITTNTHFFNGNQLDYFSELSLLVPYKSNSLVAGLNFTGDRFKKLPSDVIPISDFSNNIAGAFIQNTWNIKEKLLIEAGLRDDYHLRYGNFILPRIAFFGRFNAHWAARAGVGMGYKTPNPFASQIIDYDIEKIQPLSTVVKAEKSVGYNAELNYKKVWKNGNTFFINHAFFLTEVTDPIVATEQLNGLVTFDNAARPLVTKGFDTYIKAVVSEWELYAGYTFTIAERTYLLQNQFMPLTPKHRIAFTLVRDFEKVGVRLGLEGSYTGSQYRFDNTKTPGYMFVAAMIEKKFGDHISVVLNGENLLNYRQSNVESLYTGTISNPVFKPLWAPIDGRILNLSLKFQL